MGKSTEVSHFCESELNAFPTQVFKNAKSFVIFGSAVQTICDTFIFVSADYRHVRGQKKSHREQVQLRFYDRRWVTQRFQKNRTTERGYELNWGTNWAFNPGPVRLLYRYTA